MKNELRRIDRAADRIMIAIEDQIARPILWIIDLVERRRPRHAPQPVVVSDPANLDEWAEEKPNPLEHWRWA
jgi:hypothetical protein